MAARGRDVANGGQGVGAGRDMPAGERRDASGPLVPGPPPVPASPTRRAPSRPPRRPRRPPQRGPRLPVRPPRRLRGGVHRPAGRGAHARGGGAGAGGLGAPRAPRRRVHRPVGRRCRRAHPDPAPPVHPGGVAPGDPASGGRQHWRGDAVPPRRAAGAGAGRGAGDRGAAGGRHPAAGVARGARAPRGPGGQRARGDAGDPAGARGASRRRRRRHLGAAAVPGAPRAGAPRGRARAGRAVRLLAVVPHGGVQGAAHRRAAGGLLPRPARPGVRERHCRVPRALRHQYAPALGAGAALPAAGAQRRDQHAVGEPQRDGHARRAAGGAGVRRAGRPRPRADPPPRERLGQPGQRHGAAGARGARAGACGAHAGAAGVGALPRRGPVHQGVLRVPPVPGGAVGRPGGAGVQRRGAGGGLAGP